MHNANDMKTKSPFLRDAFLGAMIICLPLASANAQEYRVLHHFAGGHNDGAGTMGKLIQSGSALYGVTPQGGSNNIGTIFRINTDGTAFEILHSFVGESRPIGAAAAR